MKNHYDKFDMYGLRHLPIHLIAIGDLETLEAILCDLFFIGAKCAAGMTMDLIDDFNAAVALSSKIQEEKKELEIQKMSDQNSEHECSKIERNKSNQLEMRCSEEQTDNYIIGMSKNTTRSTRSDRFKFFGQFVQSEANQFAKHLKIFPRFCIQQAYNSAKSGPVAMAAKKVIDEIKTSIVLLRFPNSLPMFNPNPGLLRTIEGHASGGKSLDICFNGRIVVSGGTDKELKVWDIHSGRLIKSLKGEHEYIFSVSITPDGKYAVTGSKTVRLWDLDNNKCLREFKGHDHYIMSVVISFDGSTIISGSWDKTIRLWNAETGECKRIFVHPFVGKINCLCLTPDGKNIISGDENGIVFWNLHTGKPMKSYRIITQEKQGKFTQKIHVVNGINSPEKLMECIMAMSVPISGRIMISGGTDGIIRVWDTAEDICLKELKGHTDVVSSVTVTPCGKLAVSGSWDKTLKVWNLETGKCLRTLHGHSDSISTVAVNAEGTLAISGSEDQIMKIWNIKDGKSFKSHEKHNDEVSTMKIASDGRFVISGSHDNTLRIWNLNTGESIHKLVGHLVWVNNIRFTPDGKYIVSNSTDSTLRVWDSKSGECINIIEDIHGLNDDFELTPDGEDAIDVGGDGKSLKVIKVVSGECLANLKGHTGEIRTMSLTPDGCLLVTGGEDRVLKVWDLRSGNCLNVLEGHSETISTVKITADGRLVISGGVDETLRIWDIYTGKCLKVLKGHTREITSTQSEQSGRLILTASADETLRVWDIRTGDCSGIYSGHTGFEIQAEILLDGKRVISGGNEETIHIWDIETTECLAVLNHHNKILSLAANNNRLVIGDPVGNVTFYRLYGLDIPYAVTNSVRLWNYKKADWNEQIISTCHWCGIRFQIPQKISDVIKGITRNMNLSYDQSPCLGYPDEVWDVPELFSQCPGCKKKLKFNPFIVDNKEKVNLKC